MSIEKPVKNIEQLEEFIKHNLKLGYLKPEMTINDLLQFTKNIKESYLPLMQKIKDKYY